MTNPEVKRIPEPDPEYWPFWVRISAWSERAESWLKSHGGNVLRFGIRAFWVVIALIGVILLVGPVINKPLTLTDILDARDTAPNQWIAKEFAVDYRVETSPDGTLQAEVEERITVLFGPGIKENGIQRVVPTQYQGHALAPRDITATIDGQPVDIVRSDSPDRATLRISGETTLSGTHNFVLHYTIENLAYLADDEQREQPVDFLQWDVFGPSWPQGLSGLNVRIILSQRLADRLVSEPRGSMVWLLPGDGTILSPEADGTTGDVIYQFSNNHRTLPPHSQATFTMSFVAGTFTMPAPNAFYWVQVFGPAIPLALLLLTLLVAMAVRAVAWSDERGRPWFVAQFDPPPGISPKTAAHILGAWAPMELAEVLHIAQGYKPQGSESRAALLVAAKVARRTGRLENSLRAVSLFLSAPERDAQIIAGLRRIPSGFVRDFFLFSPIALTIVQWGLVRQISHQATGGVLWWPFSFVVVSTIVSAFILAIALVQRPLTEKGALVKQHLLGIGELSTSTSLVERGSTKNPVLPYAVLFGRARATGRHTVELIEAEVGESGVSKPS